jgi:hypothetical protein
MLAKAPHAMGTNPKRDLRIDLFRGLALVIIYIDHIPSDRLSHLTLRNFGFTSAADIFVLLAGISFALAYAPRLDARGLFAVIRQIGRRIVTIYFAHIVVLVVGLALLVTINRNSPLDLFVAAPLSWAGSHVTDAVVIAITLQYQPPFFDILPLYIALLFFAVPLLLLARVHWSFAISASALVWLLANTYALNFPSTRSMAGWYFDPMSRQIVFATGLLVGLFSLSRKRLKPSRWLLLLSVLVIAASFVAVFPCRHYGPDSSYCYFEPLSRITGLMDRQTPVRFINTLAWTYLVVCLIPRDARWLTNPLSRILTRMGKHSLAVFSVGTLLSLLARIYLSGPETSWFTQIAVFVLGTAVMATTAYLLDDRPHTTTGSFAPHAKSASAGRSFS